MTERQILASFTPQPIETAPHHSEYILVYVPNWGWHSAIWSDGDGWLLALRRDFERTGRGAGGSIYGNSSMVKPPEAPTHWLPCLAPPSELLAKTDTLRAHLTERSDAEKLQVVQDVLAYIGFNDPESEADPAKAVKALAQTMYDYEGRLEQLRQILQPHTSQADCALTVTAKQLVERCAALDAESVRQRALTSPIRQTDEETAYFDRAEREAGWGLKRKVTDGDKTP